jgi:DNA-binding beta-propeller fold protein YncE
MRLGILGGAAEAVLLIAMMFTAACDPCPSCSEHHHRKPSVLIATGTVEGGVSPVASALVAVLKAGTSPATAAQVLGEATTASDGTFQVYGNAAPATSDFLYVLATGGDAGGGTNPAIALETVYGPAATTPINVTINELTTVASAYAFTQFFNSANEFDLRDSAQPELGLAMHSYLNMIIPATGALGPAFTGALNLPYQIDLIANALAACVELAVPNACPILLNAANYPAVSGDTLGAAINMNRAPANNFLAVYNLGNSGPYQPVPDGPSDLAMTLSFGTGGVSNPFGLALDAASNLWIAGNDGNVAALDPSGAPVLSQPIALECLGGIAVDPAGKVWVSTCQSVTRIDPSVSPPGILTTSDGGFDNPAGIAADASGHIWIANYSGSSVTELDSGANPVGTQPITGGGISGPENIALDSRGNVWISNYDGSTISELDSTGAPVAASPYSDPDQSIRGPFGIAVDPSDQVWVTNFDDYSGDSITRLDISGANPAFSTYFDQLLYAPYYLAADGSGNIWVTNFYYGAVDEFDNSGNLLSESGGFFGALFPFFGPAGIAIDSAGNVWVANFGGLGIHSTRAQAAQAPYTEVVEIVGAATPIKTPLNSAPVRP